MLDTLRWFKQALALGLNHRNRPIKGIEKTYRNKFVISILHMISAVGYYGQGNSATFQRDASIEKEQTQDGRADVRACLKKVNMPNQRVFCPLDGAIFP